MHLTQSLTGTEKGPSQSSTQQIETILVSGERRIMECGKKTHFFLAYSSTTIYNGKCCKDTVWQSCSCLATSLCAHDT